MGLVAMRVLVFGESGQVAKALIRQAADIDLVTLGRDVADLSTPDICAAVLRSRIGAADVVINAAAYTAVDRAEAEPELAHAINAAAPAALAQVAAAAGKPFLHISSDYVFDGSGNAPRHPHDATGPLGVYGRTKLAGEAGVMAAGGVAVILRTSWVFSATGANFVKTMLRLGAARDRVSVVADQIGGPTPALDLGRTLLVIARRLHDRTGPGGIYHYSGGPDVSWADFARAVFAQAGMDVAVTDIPAADYPTPARRPANSRLDCSRLLADYGIDRPDWQAGLAQVIADLS